MYDFILFILYHHHFQSVLAWKTAQPLIRSCILRRLIWVYAICKYFTVGKASKML